MYPKHYMHINVQPPARSSRPKKNSNVAQPFRNEHPSIEDSNQYISTYKFAVLPYSVLVALTSRRLGARCGEGGASTPKLRELRELVSERMRWRGAKLSW